MDIDALYLLWPLVLAISLAIFALSFVVTDHVPVIVFRIMAIVGFVLTAIFVAFGIS